MSASNRRRNDEPSSCTPPRARCHCDGGRSPAVPRSRARRSGVGLERDASDAADRDTSGQGAFGFPHMAMVHGAIFDAVNSIDRRYEPYLGGAAAKRWFSQDAAVATAAHRVLVDGGRRGAVAAARALTAAARRRSTPRRSAGIAAGPAKEGGIATGEAAAWAMIAARTGDGRFGRAGFVVPPGPAVREPDDWRPTVASTIPAPGCRTSGRSSSATPSASSRADRTRSRAAPTPRSSTRSRRSARATAPPAAAIRRRGAVLGGRRTPSSRGAS